MQLLGGREMVEQEGQLRKMSLDTMITLSMLMERTAEALSTNPCGEGHKLTVAHTARPSSSRSSGQSVGACTAAEVAADAVNGDNTAVVSAGDDPVIACFGFFAVDMAIFSMSIC